MKEKSKQAEKPRPKGFDLGDILVHIIENVDNLEKESCENPREYLQKSIVFLINRIQNREVRQTQNPVTKDNIIKLEELMKKFKVPSRLPKELFSCIDMSSLYPTQKALIAWWEILANLSVITTFLTLKSSI